MSSKRNVWFKRMALAVLLLSPIAQGCGSVQTTASPDAGGCSPAGGAGGGGCSPAGGGGCTPGGGGGCTPRASLRLDMGDAPQQQAPAPLQYQQAPTAPIQNGGEQAKPAGTLT